MSSSDDVSDHIDKAFWIWVNPPRGQMLKRAGAMLKPGPRVRKTVDFGHWGDPDDGKVKRRTLTFRSWDASKLSGADFSDDDAIKTTWHCEDGEIDRLLAFLHSNVARTSRFQVVDVDSPAAAVLDLLENNDVDAQSLVDALLRHTNVDQIVSLLASSEAGLSGAQTAVFERRRQLVADLRRLIDDPVTKEHHVQSLIGNAYWIFGGRYAGVANRRHLTMLDEHDIPLLTADGTLHIVELKGPCVTNLIVWHRNHWVAGPKIHMAASQAQSYLRGLDEQGLTLSKVFENELGQHFDMSRVFATVVIGHSDHHRPDNAAREVVARTLRQYNAGINRVEVITYDQLADSAERALAFEGDLGSVEQPQEHDAPDDDPWASPPSPSWEVDEPPF